MPSSESVSKTDREERRRSTSRRSTSVDDKSTELQCTGAGSERKNREERSRKATRRYYSGDFRSREKKKVTRFFLGDYESGKNAHHLCPTSFATYHRFDINKKNATCETSFRV